MKLLIEGVVQAAQVDGLPFMPRVVGLQRADHLPMLVGQRQPLMLGGFLRRLRRPTGRRTRKIRLSEALLHGRACIGG